MATPTKITTKGEFKKDTAKGKARHRTAQRAYEAVDAKVAELEKSLLEDPA